MRVRMLIIPAVAALALLAGCTSDPAPAPSPTTNGVENLSADEILAAAAEALGDAPAVHVAGSVGEQPAGFSLDVTFAGDNMKGLVTVFGVDVDTIKIGADIYVSASAEFWEGLLEQLSNDPATADARAALAGQLASGWGKAPAAAVSSFLPVPLTVEDLLGEDAVPMPLTKGEVGEVDGTPVVTFTDAEGSVFSVAIEGEPYLLQIEQDGDVVEFTALDEAPTFEAPAGAIDLLTAIGSLVG